MTDEELAEHLERAKQWDARTPAERFDSLSRQEQTAFRAFFRGARSELQIAYRADTDTVLAPSFGKAECEWVPLSFWQFKLPGLRLTTWEQDSPLPALGMSPGSVFIKARISVTEDGWAAYDHATGRLKDHP